MVLIRKFQIHVADLEGRAQYADEPAILTSHVVGCVQSKSRMEHMTSMRIRTLRSTPLLTRSSGAQKPCRGRGLERQLVLSY